MFGCKEYNQTDFSIDHLVRSLCSLLLCCWKRVFTMTSVFFCQNSISLCPASFCTPWPNLPVTSGVSWLTTFAFQSPVMKRTWFLVFILEDVVRLHRIIILDWPKSWFWLFHKILQNNPNKCFGQPNIYVSPLFFKHRYSPNGKCTVC